VRIGLVAAFAAISWAAAFERLTIDSATSSSPAAGRSAALLK
jgi:hypothetical protein